MYVLFTADGIPGWFGPKPVQGSEYLAFDNLPDAAKDPFGFLARHKRLPDGVWVEREPPPPPTEEELRAQAEAEAQQRAANEIEAQLAAEKAAIREAKMRGIEFEGVMCSATSADQAGLLAVLTSIQLEGAAFEPTRFEFENGSALVIHLGNYAAFMALWRPFRKSFFKVT